MCSTSKAWWIREQVKLPPITLKLMGCPWNLQQTPNITASDLPPRCSIPELWVLAIMTGTLYPSSPHNPCIHGHVQVPCATESTKWSVYSQLLKLANKNRHVFGLIKMWVMTRSRETHKPSAVTTCDSKPTWPTQSPDPQLRNRKCPMHTDCPTFNSGLPFSFWNCVTSMQT